MFEDQEKGLAEKNDSERKEQSSAERRLAEGEKAMTEEERDRISDILAKYEKLGQSGELIGDDPEEAQLLMRAMNADNGEIGERLAAIVSGTMEKVSARVDAARSGALSGTDLEDELGKLGKAIVGVYGLTGADNAESLMREIDKIREKAILDSMGIAGNGENVPEIKDASGGERKTEGQRYDELLKAVEDANSFDELLSAVRNSAEDGMVPTFNSGPVSIGRVIDQIESIRDKKPGWEQLLGSGDLQRHLRRLAAEREEAEKNAKIAEAESARTNEGSEARSASAESTANQESEAAVLIEDAADSASSFEGLIDMINKASVDGMVETGVGKISAKRLTEQVSDVASKKPGWQDWLTIGPLQNAVRRLDSQRNDANGAGMEESGPKKESVRPGSDMPAGELEKESEPGIDDAREASGSGMSDVKTGNEDLGRQSVGEQRNPEKAAGESRRERKNDKIRLPSEYRRLADDAQSIDDLIDLVERWSVVGEHPSVDGEKELPTNHVVENLRRFKYNKSPSQKSIENTFADPVLRSNVARLAREKKL